MMRFKPTFQPTYLAIGQMARVCALVGMAYGTSIASFAAQPATTLPTGGQVAAGQATMGQSGNTLTIQQTSQRAVLNWNTFNVGSNAAVEFKQPNSQAVVLNRVTSATPSQIDGAINANGRVIISNTNGVTFGKGAEVNAGALVATTMNQSDAEFMSGSNTFEGNGTGKVVNKGKINITDPQGYVALLAPEVRNQGVILATVSSHNAVVVGAAEKLTLNFKDSNLIGITVDKAAVNALIQNKRAIEVSGGVIVLAAGSANQLIRSVIQNPGQISASSMTSHGGVVELIAGTVANNGRIAANAQGVGNGGNVSIVADNVKLGTQSDIQANAGTYGNGGAIHIWANQQAAIAGQLSATGGSVSGNGGSIGTSAKLSVTFDPHLKVNTSATQGRYGQWVIDPLELTIDANAATLISAALRNTNVTLDATGSACVGGLANCSTSVLPLVNFLAGANIYSDNASTTLRVLATGGTVNVNNNIDAGQVYIEAANISVKGNIGSTGGGNGSILLLGGQINILGGLGSNGQGTNAGNASTVSGANRRRLGANAGLASDDIIYITDGGKLLISATDDIVIGATAIVTANGVSGGQVSIVSQRGSVTHAGVVEAVGVGNLGGQVKFEADTIRLDDTSQIRATGNLGGGTVLVGGDWQGGGNVRQATQVMMSTGSSIDASATENGNGGKVVLWSDVHNVNAITSVHGAIYAMGGAKGGNGGQVETSGRLLQVDGIAVSTAATLGNAGQWLLDPYNIVINTGGAQYTNTSGTITSNNTCTDPGSGCSSYIDHTVIETALASGNVTVQSSAGYNITIQGDGTVTTNSSNTLTYQSGGNITFNYDSATYPGGITGSNLNVVLQATGAVSLAGAPITVKSLAVSGTGLSGNSAIALGVGGMNVNQSGNSSYSGIISGASAAFTKTGAGTLTLMAANTYAGATTINGGTLSVSLLANGGTASNIGQSTNVATNLVIDGGTLQFTGAAQSTDRLFKVGANGATIDASGTGALTFSNSGITGNVSGSSPTLTLTGSGSATLGAALSNPTSGTASLTKSGSGTWSLINSGAGVAQYTGSTSILGGVLSVVARYNGQPIGGSLYIDGATLRLTGSTSCTITGISCSVTGIFNVSANGATLDASATGGSFSIKAPTVPDTTSPVLTLTGTGSGILSTGFNNPAIVGASSPSLVKNGSGIWSVASGTYEGVTTIREGTLSVSTLANGGVASGLGKSSNAASNLVINGGTLKYTGAAVSTDRLFTIGANGGTIDSSGTGTLTFSNTANLVAEPASSPTLTVTGTYAATLNPVLTDPATSGILSLAKTGTNTWTLASANTFTGSTTISAGTLTLGNATALGSGTTNVNVTTGGTLNIAALTFDRKVNFVGGTIRGTGTLTGDITLTANSTFYGDSASIPLTVNSLISDAGSGYGLIIGTASSNLVKISNAANAYSGATTVNNGTLMFGNADAIPATSALVINPTGTLDSAGLTITRAITLAGGTVTNTVNSGSYTGAITLTANSTLKAQNGTGLTIAGAGIGESGGSRSITISSATGSGVVTYAATNTYTGTTTVAAGVLRLGGVGVIDNLGPVVLGTSSSAGTLDLAGYTTSKFINAGSGIYAAILINSTGNGEVTGGIAINAPFKIYAYRGATLKISGAAMTGANNPVSIGEYCGSTCYYDGTVIFANSVANTYGGNTSVGYGTLQLGASTANLIPNGTTLTVGAGATFDVAGYSFNGALSLGNTATVISSAGTTGELTGGVTIGNTGGSYIAAASGSVLTIKTNGISGSGGWINYGTSTYTGTVAINAATNSTINMYVTNGKVQVGHALALGPVTGAGNVTVNSGAVLDLNGQTLTNSGSLTLNGTGIANSGALFNSSTTSATYSGLLLLGSATTIVADTGSIAFTKTGTTTGSYVLTLDGAQGGSISSALGTTSGGVTKIGSGTWTLSGANTYTGATTINAGTLQLGTGGSLSSSTPVTMSGTANFDLYGNNVSLYSLTGGANNLIYNSKVGTTATLNISGATSSTYAGVVADNTGTGGTVALTRSGTGGTSVFTLTGANTYTGGTTVSGNILAISSDANLGAVPSSFTANAITLSGGELQATATVSLGANRGITLTAGSTLSVTLGNTLTVNGIIDGGFGLTINKASMTGKVLLTGANTYSGNTSIFLGTLQMGSTTAMGSGNATVTSGAVLDLNGQTMTSTGTLTLNGTGVGSNGALINSSTTGATYAGLITLGSASSIVGDTGTIAVTNNGTITGATFGLTLGGAQGGSIASIIGTTSGGLTKQGAGTWLLSGLNTFTGASSITAGILKVGSGAALGASTSNATVSSGAMLDLNGIAMTNTNLLVLNGTGIGAAGALMNSSATTASYAGTVSLNSTSSIGVANGNITLTGIVSNTYALTKVGANTLTLAGPNTYSGGTTISAGTLKLANATALGAAASGVTVVSGAVLDLNGVTMTNANALILNGDGIASNGALINSNSGTGATYTGLISLATDSTIGGAGTIAITNTGTITGSTKNLTLSGAGGSIGSIIGTSSGNLTVSSTGAWTLTKANTYTGITSIKSGTLILGAAAPSGAAGALGNATSAVLLGDTSGSNNAALLTNGAYTIARAITVQSGNTGIMTIGGTGAFNSTYSGNITLNKDATLTADSSGLVSFSGSSGQFSGAGGVGKSGAGTVLLGTWNSMSGATTISAGTLKLGNAVALGTTPSIAISAGAALDLNGLTYSGTPAVTLNGGGISAAGAITNSNATAATFGGAVTLGSASAIGSTAGAMTLSGRINDPNNYGLVFVGNKAISLTASNNALSTIASAASTGALTVVNYSNLSIDSVVLGGVTYNGINSTGAISVKVTAGNLYIGQNVATTSTSSTASAPAMLLAAGSNSGVGSFTYNIQLSGTPSFSVGTGGIADFYSGISTSSTGLDAAIGSLSPRSFTYAATISTQPTAAGYNVIYRTGQLVYVTIVPNQTGTYGVSKGLQYWYSISPTSYGLAYVPTALQANFNQVQTFTAGATTVNFNSNGLTGSLTLGGDASSLGSTLNAGTYNLTLTPSNMTLTATTLTFVAGNASTLTVNPATLVVSSASNAVTYNGLVQTNTGGSIRVNGGSPITVVNGAVSTGIGSDGFTVSGYGSGANVSATAYVDNLAATPSGSTNGSNYSISYVNAGGGLTINKATLTYTATAANSTYGSTPNVNAGTLTGFVNNETASVLTGALVFSTPATATSAVGHYAINGGGYTSDNYQFVQAAGNATALTIGKASLTYTANAASTTYGSAPIVNAGAISGFVNNETDAVLSGTMVFTTTATSSSNVGQYAITGSGYSSGNYQFLQAASNATAFTVNPAPLTVTGVKAYDGTVNLSYTHMSIGGAKNGETVSLTAGSATATANSVANYAGTTLNNLAIGVTGGNASAANYTLPSIGNMSITARAVTLTANSQSTVYGTSLSLGTNAYTLSSGSLASGDVISAVTLQYNGSATIPANTIAGTYANGIVISNATGTGGFNASNYAITYVPADLTIAQKAITLTANPQATTYGTALGLGTSAYTLSSGSLANGDAISAVTLQYNSSANVPASTSAGTYTNGIMASGATGTGGFNSTNYAITYVSADLTVSPKAITLAANAQSTTYGTALNLGTNAYTLTSGALVNGDTISTVTLQYSGNATVPSATSAGTYTNGIVASAATGTGGFNATNYAITYSPADLTVYQKAITLSATTQSTTYGTALNLGTTAYTISSGSLASGDAISAVTLKYNGNATVPNTTNAATYANGIVASAVSGTGGFNTSNYAITYAPADLIVNPKAVTITNNVSSTTYNATSTYASLVSAAGYSATALAGTDAIGSVTQDFTVGGTAVSGIAQAGTFVATPSAAVLSTGSVNNYAFTYVPSTNTVAKANVSFTATASLTGNVYNGTAYTGTYTHTLLGSDTVTVTGVATGTNAGTYTSNLQVSGAALANYNTPVITNASLVIDQKPLTISGQTAVSKVYTGTTAAALDSSGASLVGVVSGDAVVLDAGNAYGTFVSANVANGIPVTVAGNALSGAKAGNYSLSQPTGLTANITPAPLVITANNDAKFVTQSDAVGFGGASYSGFVAGQSASDLTGALVITRSNNTQNNAGQYAGVLVPSGLTSGNYSISYVNGDYNIVPAQTLLINTPNTSVTYGAAISLSPLSVQYLNGTNVLKTLTQTAASGNTFTYSDDVGGSATFTLAGVGNSSTSGKLVVGNYDITGLNFSKVNNNFNSTPVYTGVLTVRQQSVSASTTTVSKVYDGTTAMNGLSLALSNVVTNDVVTVGGVGAFAQANRGTNINYSVSNLTLTGADSGNYYLSGGNSFSGNNGVITAAPLVVEGATSNTTYTGLLQTNSAATISGLKGNDSFTVTGYASATNASLTPYFDNLLATPAAGTTASNYNITYSNGTLNIAKVPLTVTAASMSKPYDGQLHSGGNGVAYSGFVNNETLAVLGGTLTYTGTSQGANNAGTYVLTPAGLSSSNYTFNYVSGSLTIQPAVVVPEPVYSPVQGVLTGTVSKSYDGTTSATLSSSNYVLTGFVSGQGATVLKSQGVYDNANVGTGKLVTVQLLASDFQPTGATNLSNYILPSSISGRVGVISKATVSVAADNLIKPFMGVDPVLTYTVSGMPGRDVNSQVLTGSPSRTPGEALGTYSVNVGSLTVGSNYELVFTPGTLQVVPGVLSSASSVFPFERKAQMGIVNAREPVLLPEISCLKPEYKGPACTKSIHTSSL